MIGAAIGMGLTLGSAGLNYLAKRKMIRGMKKRPSWADSDQAKELRRRRTEGIYSPKTRQTMMNRTGQITAHAENTGKAEFMGHTTRMGLENSMARTRGLSDYTRARMKKLTDTGQDIDRENEFSKMEAADRYGSMQWQDKQADWQHKNYLKTLTERNRSDLISGVASGLGTGVSGILGKMQPTQYQGMMNEYQKSGDPSSLLVNLTKMGMKYEEAIEVMRMIAAGG